MAKLHAALVECVNLPNGSLSRDGVLVQGDELAERCRGPLGEDGVRRPVAVKDAIPRVIEVDSHRLGRETFTAFWVMREQIAEVQLAEFLIMSFERLPYRPLGSWDNGVSIYE